MIETCVFVIISGMFNFSAVVQYFFYCHPQVFKLNTKEHPNFTSGVGRLLHLPSAEAVSFWPNAHPRM